MKGLLLIVISLISAAAAADDWTYVEELSGQPQGGIIIRYPDLARSHVLAISEQLRHHGWSSVLVPIATSQASKSPEVTTRTIVDHMKQERGQHNLVLLTLGDVWDNAMALEGIESEDGQSIRPVQALVLIDVPGEIAPINELPTLDISTTAQPVPGFMERQHIRRRDNIESSQSLHLRYSTRKPPFVSGAKSTFLVRRIRGWLQHAAQGMEVSEPAP